MKGLITAGGRATRLRPITNTINKHLIPLANKPMIFYALERMEQSLIKDIAVIINEDDKEIEKAIGDGSRLGLKITYIEQKGGPKGLAHALKCAENFINGDSFIYYLGDNIVGDSLEPFIEKFKKENLNGLLVLNKVKDPQRFGVPEIKEGKIIRVTEKPKEPQTPFAVTGIYLYDSNIFKMFPDLKPSERGEYEISDLHTLFIERGYKVGFEEIKSWWKDTGKPEDLLEGNQFVLNEIENKIEGEVEDGVIVQGKVQIGKNTKVNGKTTIRGPAVIGENCVIKESYIGPFSSIGNRVEIYKTEVENSVILDECDLTCEARIVDSILGANSTILPAHQSWPSGHKLIIGSNSVVEL